MPTPQSHWKLHFTNSRMSNLPIYSGLPLLTTDHCSNFSINQFARQQTKTNKRKLALITLDRCCFANLFAWFQCNRLFTSLRGGGGGWPREALDCVTPPRGSVVKWPTAFHRRSSDVVIIEGWGIMTSPAALLMSDALPTSWRLPQFRTCCWTYGNGLYIV